LAGESDQAARISTGENITERPAFCCSFEVDLLSVEIKKFL
jgi:hypothetical protein